MPIILLLKKASISVAFMTLLFFIISFTPSKYKYAGPTPIIIDNFPVCGFCNLSCDDKDIRTSLLVFPISSMFALVLSPLQLDNNKSVKIKDFTSNIRKSLLFKILL